MEEVENAVRVESELLDHLDNLDVMVIPVRMVNLDRLDSPDLMLARKLLLKPAISASIVLQDHQDLQETPVHQVVFPFKRSNTPFQAPQDKTELQVPLQVPLLLVLLDLPDPLVLLDPTDNLVAPDSPELPERLTM